MNISKLIPILKNAIKINKNKVSVPASKKIIPFLEVLYQENFIAGFKQVSYKETTIYFCRTYKTNKILSLKSISKPSKPIYFSLQDLWKFNKSLFTIIVSTPFGVITHNSALKKLCGGKVLCIVF